MISLRFVPFEVEVDYIDNNYVIDVGQISIGYKDFKFTGSLFYIQMFQLFTLNLDNPEDSEILGWAWSVDLFYFATPLASIVKHLRRPKRDD